MNLGDNDNMIWSPWRQKNWQLVANMNFTEYFTNINYSDIEMKKCHPELETF